MPDPIPPVMKASFKKEPGIAARQERRRRRWTHDLKSRRLNRSPNAPCCHFVRSGRGLKLIELPPSKNRSSHGDPENLPRSGTLSGASTLVTSATGDEGASQQPVQLISLHCAEHLFHAFVVRGRLLRSARQTSDQSECASRPLCVSANDRFDRATSAQTERLPFSGAAVQFYENKLHCGAEFGHKRSLKASMQRLVRLTLAFQQDVSSSILCFLSSSFGAFSSHADRRSSFTSSGSA